MKKYYYNSPIGRLWITEKDEKIANISFSDDFDCQTEQTALINFACCQLDEYFAGKRKKFDLPLYIEGTEFQKQVWKALLLIAYGQTVSYKDIAEIIGQPKAMRAVGGANNKNKIAIIIPCHRVIGKNKHLTGYAGGLKAKQYLLDLERHYCEKDC